MSLSSLRVVYWDLPLGKAYRAAKECSAMPGRMKSSPSLIPPMPFVFVTSCLVERNRHPFFLLYVRGGFWIFFPAINPRRTRPVPKIPLRGTQIMVVRRRAFLSAKHGGNARAVPPVPHLGLPADITVPAPAVVAGAFVADGIPPGNSGSSSYSSSSSSSSSSDSSTCSRHRRKN